ncbi:MAG: hypothetical protein ACRCYY_14010 [Trueperaceae bacterium]
MKTANLCVGTNNPDTDLPLPPIAPPDNDISSDVPRHDPDLPDTEVPEGDPEPDRDIKLPSRGH